jgi:hypothetical protein
LPPGVIITQIYESRAHLSTPRCAGEWQKIVGAAPSGRSAVGCRHALPPHHAARPRSAAALDFFVAKLGLRELRRQENEAGRFTLVFLGTGADGDGAEIELTYNWDQTEPYPTGRLLRPPRLPGRRHLRDVRAAA